MLRQDEDGRYPLSGGEYSEMQIIMGLVDALSKARVLDERLKLVKYGKRDIGCIRRKVMNVFDGLLATIPFKKLKMIREEISRTQIQVKVIGAAGQSWDDMNVVRTKDLLTIMESAMEQNCLLCSKSEKAGRQCTLYKALNACLPYEPDKSADGFCPLAGSACLEEHTA